MTMPPPPSSEALLAAFTRLGRCAALAVDRHELYRTAERILDDLVGHRLFTLLVVLPGGEEVQRFWTSNEAAYPTTGRKRIGSTPWGLHVLTGGQVFLGRDAAAIRWAFADHATILSLGLGSVVNVPVMAEGRVLGTLNLLHEAGWYGEAAATVVEALAPLLAHAFAAERQTLHDLP